MLTRVGVIGAGFVGPELVEALRRLGHVEVVALAGSNARRARERADELGIPEACGDYRELLGSPRLTVIHNATPNYLHYAINHDALRAHKHVVTEGPLALTVDECRALVNQARRGGLVNAVDYDYRGYSLLQQMRIMVARGDIGQVWAVNGAYMQDWLLYPTDYNWRVLPEMGGESRAVADIGSHWCDLAQWVTGQRISRVMARLAIMVPTRLRPPQEVPTFAEAAAGPRQEVQIRTEDYCAVLIDLDGGATGSFVVSQVSAGSRNRLWIQVDGSEGSLAWDQDRADELRIGRRSGPSGILPRDPRLLEPEAARYTHLPAGHQEGWADALRNLMGAIYEFIRSGKDPLRERPTFATFYDGLVQGQLVEAILESHRRGSWVDVPPVSELLEGEHG